MHLDQPQGCDPHHRLLLERLEQDPQLELARCPSRAEPQELHCR